MVLDIRWLQQLVMERAVLSFGELWVASVGAEVVGAAMWMHPDRVPHPAVWSSMSGETSALEGSRHDASVILGRADEELVETYLETSTESNVAFYSGSRIHRDR